MNEVTKVQDPKVNLFSEVYILAEECKNIVKLPKSKDKENPT